MSEAEFMQEIIAEAKRLGYLVYHTHDSRRSEVGFPDLVMVAPKIRIVFAVETKDTRKKPTAEQAAWLERLDNSHIIAECWKPKDKERAFSLLSRYGNYLPEPSVMPLACDSDAAGGKDGVRLKDRMTAAEFQEWLRTGGMR